MDTYNLTIYKGDTFSLSVTLKDGDGIPINLSGYETSGYARFSYGASGYLVNLGVRKEVPFASGVISLNISDSVSSLLPVTIFPYDVELYNSGLSQTTKALRGYGFVYPESTY